MKSASPRRTPPAAKLRRRYRDSSSVRLSIPRILTWLGCLATLGIWLFVKFQGDATLFGTIALFAPRWVYLIPAALTLLFVAHVSWYERSLQAGTLIVGFCSLMLFNIPIGGMLHQLPVVGRSPANATSIRVMTWNMGVDENAAHNLPAMIELSSVDLVLLQEAKSWQKEVNTDIQWPDGWQSHRVSTLIVASRYPLSDFEIVQRDVDGLAHKAIALFATVECPQRKIRVATMHFLSPQPALRAAVGKSGLQPDNFPEARRYLVDRRNDSIRCNQGVVLQQRIDIVGGDFNMPRDSRTFQTDWSWMKSVHQQAGWGFGHTADREFLGLTIRSRIDHILLDKRNWCQRCWVGPKEAGSDHRPVFADVLIR